MCCSPRGCKESDVTRHTVRIRAQSSSLRIMPNREKLEIDVGGSFHTSGWEKIQCDRDI